MTCLTTDQLTVAVCDPDPGAAAHLAGCDRCATRLAELTARLAAATAAPGPNPAGRGRLLAALAAEPIPVTPIWRRTLMNRRNWAAEPIPVTPIWRRTLMNRRNWAAAAAAGAVAAGLFLGLGVGPPGVAVAEVLRPFREAKSFTCRMVLTKNGQPVPGQTPMRLVWAAPGSVRTEGATYTFIQPHGQPGVRLDHADKKFTPTAAEKPAQVTPLLKLLTDLAADTGREKPAGTDLIDGVKAVRYELKRGGQGYKVWADPATNRPVRIDPDPPTDPDLIALGDLTFQTRFEGFEWDVPTDGLFDTAPPAGYKTTVETPEQARERTLKEMVGALRWYREKAGKYPAELTAFKGPKMVLDARPIETELRAVAGGEWPPRSVVNGFVQMGVLLGGAGTEYHGKTVGPADGDKVLFRWLVSDGDHPDGKKYQVITADLRVRTE
jgi:hypothetical protein